MGSVLGKQKFLAARGLCKKNVWAAAASLEIAATFSAVLRLNAQLSR